MKAKYIRRRIIASMIVALFISGGGYAAWVTYKASSVVGNASQDLERGKKSDLRDEEVKPLTHNISILIMGVDESSTREKEYGDAVRTDALLLATFNKNDKSVKLTSIPRDTYTYIPIEKKKDKITHAHAFGTVKNGKDGGPQAAIEAVEGLLNVPVDYFIKFNFDSFMKIIDAIGGIEMDVPVEFKEQDSKDVPDAIHLKKGIQTLNGEEALALARTRHIDSDAMRGQRQQLVIEAIVKKLASAGSVTKVGSILDSLEGTFKTNLSFDDLLSFYKYGINASIEKFQIKGQDAYLGDGIAYPEYVPGHTYYYFADKKSLNELTTKLRTHLGLKPEFTQKYKQNKKDDTDMIKEMKND